MPVIIPVPNDVTDLVVQGEQLRSVAFASKVNGLTSPLPLLLGSPTISYTALVQGEISIAPQNNGGIELRSRPRFLPLGNNAVIATPCGALIDFRIGAHLLGIIDRFIESTQRLAITGRTLNCATGAVLPGATVKLFRTATNEYIGETISDGIGNFSIDAPGTPPFFLVAYLAGSPDIAGTTVNSLIAA